MDPFYSRLTNVKITKMSEIQKVIAKIKTVAHGRVNLNPGSLVPKATGVVNFLPTNVPAFLFSSAK